MEKGRLCFEQIEVGKGPVPLRKYGDRPCLGEAMNGVGWRVGGGEVVVVAGGGG